MIKIKAITPELLSNFFKNLGNVFATKSHKHTKSEITDFPSSLPANGGNSSTVNNHNVNSDVPTEAKFTDTNTWRPVINNLTTTATGSALDAAQGKALNDSITSLKKSVSDGKTLVANAITNKGVTTATDATFITMANNIKSLSSSDSISILKKINTSGQLINTNQFSSIVWDDSYVYGASMAFPYSTSSSVVNIWYLFSSGNTTGYKSIDAIRIDNYIFYGLKDNGSVVNNRKYFSLTIYDQKTDTEKKYENVTSISITIPKSTIILLSL